MSSKHYFTLDAPSAFSVTIDGVEVARSEAALVLREMYGDKALTPRTYFPRSDVDLATLVASDRRTRCPIKGECGYWDWAPADGEHHGSVAWSYDAPIASAEAIRDYVAFDDDQVTVSAG